MVVGFGVCDIELCAWVMEAREGEGKSYKCTAVGVLSVHVNTNGLILKRVNTDPIGREARAHLCSTASAVHHPLDRLLYCLVWWRGVQEGSATSRLRCSHSIRDLERRNRLTGHKSSAFC